MIVQTKNMCTIVGQSQHLSCANAEPFNINDDGKSGLVECSLSEDQECKFRHRAIVTVQFEGEAGK